ncbi:MAG: Na(+)-translocating NADH-quinone reductase subunit C [Nitrosomonas sp.]|nr:Na(+)-translocating NADH-quinone reductase subunit C [Nitrosomonas sp.]MDP1950633.1 Na(+)-translocating NADH-quinone reductase subunit C [Nitrosomonas sp.]
MAEPDTPPVKHSNRKTLLVAFAVCLVCSLIVASAAVLLKPIQMANQSIERKRILVEIADLMKPGLTVAQAYQQVDIFMVELSSGLVTDAFDPEKFDITKAVKDVNLSIPLQRNEDPAQIRRKPKYLPVYRVNDSAGKLKTLILPVYGYGLWSTLYGFIALQEDMRTIQGLRFHQHAETPGLGGEVDNPRWLALWKGKIAFDDHWEPRIELIKGTVGTSTPDSHHKVDGLSGATLTTHGVTQLLNFWLGKEGFGPYLIRLREERERS